MTLKKWPWHPKPYQGQLLYRWIEELAETYGAGYQRFCSEVLELTAEEISNLHIESPEKALLILSNGTGVPIGDLRKRNVYTMFNILIDELSHRIEKNPEEFSFLLKRVHKR